MKYEKMSFEEFWNEYKRDYDESGDPVWNWSSERYNAMKNEAKEIYNKVYGGKEC